MGRPDPLELPEPSEQLGSVASLDRMVSLEFRVRWETQAAPDIRVRMASGVFPALRVTPVTQDRRDRSGQPDRKDLEAIRVLLELLEFWDRLVRSGSSARLDHPDQPDHLEILDSLDSVDHPSVLFFSFCYFSFLYFLDICEIFIQWNGHVHCTLFAS